MLNCNLKEFVDGFTENEFKDKKIAYNFDKIKSKERKLFVLYFFYFNSISDWSKDL